MLDDDYIETLQSSIVLQGGKGGIPQVYSPHNSEGSVPNRFSRLRRNPRGRRAKTVWQGGRQENGAGSSILLHCKPSIRSGSCSTEELAPTSNLRGAVTPRMHAHHGHHERRLQPTASPSDDEQSQPLVRHPSDDPSPLQPFAVRGLEEKIGRVRTDRQPPLPPLISRQRPAPTEADSSTNNKARSRDTARSCSNRQRSHTKYSLKITISSF